MSGGWLTWGKDQLHLINDKGLTHTFDFPIAAKLIDRVGFAVEYTWQLAIPTENDIQLLVSTNGKLWHHLPKAPLHGSIMRTAVGLHPYAERISIIETGQFHFYGAGQGWQTQSLPDGADWIGTGIDGQWWAVGSQPSTRIRVGDQEIAVWRCTETERVWEAIHIQTSWRDAYRTIRDGGFEKISAVNAQSNPIVLASECAWFLEDPSWFLFTQKSSGQFAVQRLPKRILARIARNKQGQPIAITTDGELWDWNGRKWLPRHAARILHQVLGYPAHYGGYRVHLAVAGIEIYGVVTNFDHGQQPNRIAIQSMDGGQSWCVVNLDKYIAQQVIAAWAQ